MSQNAIIKRIVGDGVAEVSLMRQMDCKNCASCGGCTQKPGTELLAKATNTIGAQVGDTVVVESVMGNSISIAVIVFLFPCLFLMLGYFLGQAMGLSELHSVAIGALGILVGFVPALVLNRIISRSRKPEMVILSKLH